jgi:dolichol kinase
VTDGVLRRTLHTASAAVLLLVPWMSWTVCRNVIFGAALLAVVVEAVRLRVPRIGRALMSAVPVYRAAEGERPSGAMWLAVGYALAALFAPPASVAGILVSATADPAASWIGSTAPARRGKTWRGSAAHLVVAAAVLAACGVPWSLVVGAAAVATAVERWVAPVDDNLVVAPAVAATVAWFQ